MAVPMHREHVQFWKELTSLGVKFTYNEAAEWLFLCGLKLVQFVPNIRDAQDVTLTRQCTPPHPKIVDFLTLFVSSPNDAFLLATGHRGVQATWMFKTKPQTYDLSPVNVAEAL